MQFWSKGLGKRSLGIDCGSESVSVENGLVQLRGTVKPPLTWTYTITMDAADWAGCFDVALGPPVVRYLLHPKRWPLALRAAWHFAAFLWAYGMTLRGRRVVRDVSRSASGRV
jgi:hypothetical protein